MKLDESVLSNTERIIFGLRSLYRKHGYERYRMRRFEEYELYSQNKDFLVSDHVIVFTDTNGKLMALKPDVTLSVIKNSRDDPKLLRKLCYNESVYRVSKSTGSFREIMQTGIECIGNVGAKELAEVLFLAGESLAELHERNALVISDLDILQSFLDEITDLPEERQKLIRCIGEKNLHGIVEICSSLGNKEKSDRLKRLLSLCGKPEKVLPALDELCRGECMEEDLERLKRILTELSEKDCRGVVELDFSLVSDMNYYNGIIFKGYIEGIPESVLSGGQYDRLMEKMEKRSKAAGFAVYLDTLERITLPMDGQ